MKTFKQVIDQPTVKDGSYKAGNWLSKLREHAPSVETSGSMVINGVNCQLPTVAAMVLQPAFDGSTNLDELLVLMRDGFASTLQANVAKSGVSTVESVPVGHVLSLEQFKDSYFRQSATLEKVKGIYTTLSVLTDADSKENILSAVKSVLSTLLPDEAHAAITEYERKQANNIKLLNLFSPFFVEGTPFIVRDGVISGRVPSMVQAKALADFAKTKGIVSGGKVVDLSPDKPAMVFGAAVQSDDIFADAWTGRSITIAYTVKDEDLPQAEPETAKLNNKGKK